MAEPTPEDERPVCSGCFKTIRDLPFRWRERQWHQTCLRIAQVRAERVTANIKRDKRRRGWTD